MARMTLVVGFRGLGSGGFTHRDFCPVSGSGRSTCHLQVGASAGI